MSSTHTVTNQVPPLVGHDPVAGDTALVEACLRHADPLTLDSLEDLGALAGSEQAAEWGRLANENPPRLRTHDRTGHRIDEVEFHPAWHDLMGAAVGQTRLDRPLLAHLANSAATLTRPDLHRDLVRPGIAVYGLDPTDDGVAPALRPAMTFRSRVALLKTVAAGEGVSYGHTWTTPTERTLALVPAGYADGVPRLLGATGRFSVVIGGVRRPVVGRVCMDQVMVDLGPAGERHGVAEGDEVLLFGPDEAGPTAAEWAGLLGTIHYEIVTGVGGRPRVRRTVTGSSGQLTP